MGSEGVAALAAAVPNCPRLRQLDVEDCDVGDEAAQQLRALERLATRSDPASYLQVYVS